MQLRKMEAGASDKDEVEASNGSLDTCSMILVHRQVREEEMHHSKMCAVLFLDSYGMIKMYPHFPAVHCVWCKGVKGSILPWVDFNESC